MSNLFDVLKRSGTFDLGEAPGSQEVLRNEPVAAAKLVLDKPVVLPSPAARVVPLRVSTTTPIFPFEEVESVAAEQYRIVRTKILHHPRTPKVLAVSSASSGDGKTVSSINIAAALALKQDIKVVLVDADLRRRNVAEMLGVVNAPGLSEVLCGLSDLESALVQAEQFPNLSILTAGDLQASPAELLDSEALRKLLDRIRQQFDYVVLDATPVAAVADYELIQLACDGVIAIVRPEHTDRATCLKMLQTVPKEKLIGVVLNCVEDWWLWKTPQYGYSSKKG